MNTTNHTSPSCEDAADGATVGEANPVVTVPLLHYQDLVRKAGELRDLKTDGAIWEREAFEAWFKTAGIWNDVIAWRAWQARASLTAEKVAAEPFPYQRTFDAIAAATSVCAGRVAISVIDFRKAFAAPQPAQPTQAATLSADQILQIAEDHDFDIDTLGTVLEEFARAILAASAGQTEQTAARDDVRDAARYRFIRSQMKVGAVKTQLPLYRTLHWIGYEDCTDTANADEAVDAEIERIDRAAKESNNHD